tara:strand:+ start:194 stop:469 length:276 start_codon:yes stop_codon:yes gene_type:complete
MNRELVDNYVSRVESIRGVAQKLLEKEREITGEDLNLLSLGYQIHIVQFGSQGYQEITEKESKLRTKLKGCANTWFEKVRGRAILQQEVLV